MNYFVSTFGNISLAQGGDAELEFAIFDGSNVVDLTAIVDVKGTISYKGYALTQLSLIPTEGYKTITIKDNDANKHIILLNLLRTDTKEYPVGALDIEFTIKYDETTYKTFLFKNGLYMMETNNKQINF